MSNPKVFALEIFAVVVIGMWLIYMIGHRGYMREFSRFGCGVYSVFHQLPEEKTSACTKKWMFKLFEERR